MNGFSAYSVDTLGLPDPNNVVPDPAAARARLVFLEMQRRNPPGQATQDRYAQAALGYKNHAYLAINTLLRWLRRAKLSIQTKQRATVMKSLGALSSDSSKWSPVDDEHPAHRLLMNPNPNQTFRDYITERSLCRCIFGLSLEWVVLDRTGAPRELHVLRPQYVTALPITTQYPYGAYRLSIPQPMYGFAGAGWVVIDGRNILKHTYPHPMYPWDGLSPNTAAAQMLDLLGATIGSMKNSMDNGFSPKAVITLGGVGEDEMLRMEAKIKDRFSGSDGAQYMITAGDEVKAVLLNTTPDKMGFGGVYTDSAAFSSALYGVPSELSGLGGEIGSFSKLYASVKMFQTGTLGDEAESTAEFWTERLIRPNWPGHKVCLDIPSIEDDTTRPQTLLAALTAGAVRVNEYRAALDMEPDPDGDVYLPQWNQQFAPPPGAGGIGNGMGEMASADGNDTLSAGGANGDQTAMALPAGDEGDDAYPQAIMNHVLQAFGIDPSAEQDEPADDGSEDDAGFVAKSWTRVSTKTGHTAATDGNRTIYGAEAEAALAAQNKQPGQAPPGETRHNPDLDDAFGQPAQKAAVAPPGDLRPNADLDAVFGGGDEKSAAAPNPSSNGKPQPSPQGQPKPNAPPANLKQILDDLDKPAPRQQPAPAPHEQAKSTADKAAQRLDPVTIPVAKEYVAKVKNTVGQLKPATPQQQQQLASPRDWMAKLLPAAIGAMVGTLAMNRGSVSKLLIFGVLAAIHMLTKQNGATPEEPIRPGDDQLKDRAGNKVVTDLVPTAMPKKAVVTATPKKAGTGAPKAQPFTQPKNAAGKGSLPGKIAKSLTAVSWDAYFAGIVEEELAGTAS